MEERAVDRVTLPINPELYNTLHNDFVSWYVKAKPGEWYTYHRGYSLHENLVTEKVKETAWNFACEGKVYLFLQRDVEHKHWFCFLCQKSTPGPKNPRLIPKR